MTQRDGLGLGLAVVGHVAVFALLSLAWTSAPPPPPQNKPIEVSLADDVALDQHAPAAPEPPAQSAAPEAGPPEEAPPPAKVATVTPEPAPPKPQPEAAPPPKPAPKPVPAPKKPVAEKPDKPVKTKTPPAKAAAPAAKTEAKATVAKAAGTNPKATKPRPTGSLLDDDFRKGLTQAPSHAKVSQAAPGATMDAKATADIGSAIQRQVQPCANRQVIPGPGAAKIVAYVRLQFNRDGSLAARPAILPSHRGVDDDNRIYVDAVDRAAIATFTGCAPLRGLPPELYDVPRGWKVFTLTYHMPG